MFVQHNDGDLLLALSKEEIDSLMKLLVGLKNDQFGHFHLRYKFDKDDCENVPGVTDIEFSLMGEADVHNMEMQPCGGKIIYTDKP